MKVLLVEPFGHLWSGHFPTHAKSLARGLGEAGLDVTLLTFKGLIGGLYLEDNTTKQTSAIAELGAGALPVRGIWRLLSIPPFRLLAPSFETVITFWVALRQNRKHGYDMIHVLDTATRSFLFLLLASTVKYHCLVLTLHGVPREIEFRENNPDFRISLKGFNLPLLFNFALAKMTGSVFGRSLKKRLYNRSVRRNRIAFVCFAEGVKQTYSNSPFYSKISCLQDARPKSATVSRMEARHRLRLPQEGVVFLVFGSNHGLKHYEVIFQSLREISKGIKVMFAGKLLPDAARENDPVQLVNEYGLRERTVIIDKYIDEERAYYFCAADALILSYRHGFAQHSSNLLWSCQYGLPVLAVDYGHIGEQVKCHGLGLTFTPEDPTSLREAIESFLNLSDEARQAMKERIARFDPWEQMKRGYLELYQRLRAE